jgi:hypothetical protein
VSAPGPSVPPGPSGQAPAGVSKPVSTAALTAPAVPAVRTTPPAGQSGDR